jgi:hypothetical protein
MRDAAAADLAQAGIYGRESRIVFLQTYLDYVQVHGEEVVDLKDQLRNKQQC